MNSFPWVNRIWQDLQPTPGRLNSSLRIVLATIITLILFMVWRMPFASVGLFFVFIVGRDSPSVSFRSGFLAMITLVASVVAEIGVIIITDNDPMARVLGVAIVGFIAALFTVATTLPAFPPIWGFIFCTLIALWETHVPADTTVKNSLWLLASTALPVASSIAVEYVFGARRPVDQLQEARRTRYLALEAMYRTYAQESDAAKLLEARLRVIRLAAAGQQEMQRLYNTIVDRDLDPGILPVGARVRISMLAQLMDVSAAFATQQSEAQPADIRQRCAKIADVCRDFSDNFSPKEEGVLPIRAYESSILLDRVERILQDILAMPSKRGIPSDRRMIALPSKKVPYFIPGALTNRNNVAFALKLSLCATACYILYFAVDWPGISTAVTTVFITGLSTTGAIKQKFTYRILGAIIGGLILGIGATAFLFPYMDSITSLVVLMGAVALASAWIAGGRIFNYVGLQIAFSFYLVALEGFSAPTQLAPARDRLAGILLALIVMWLVFDRLWPVRTVTVMRRSLASVLQNDISLFRLDSETLDHEERLGRADTIRDRIGKTVASLRTMSDEIAYELGVDRQRHVQTSEEILRAAFTTVALFWNELAVLHGEQQWDFVHDPVLIEMRKQMADRMEVMAEAVVEKKQYTITDLKALVGPELLDKPLYGEYARNALSRFHELQITISELCREV